MNENEPVVDEIPRRTVVFTCLINNGKTYGLASNLTEEQILKVEVFAEEISKIMRGE